MAITFPNQKNIIIHKEYPKSDFMQISNNHWMEFNKKYGPYALQVYLYLAKNADKYSLALSQQAAENEAGITKTTFHKYIDLLIDKGYLVWQKGNIYHFYETPHKQEQKDVGHPPCGELLSSQSEQQNLSRELRSSTQITKPPQPNKEINNRYTDNIDKIRDNLQQQEEISCITKIAEDNFYF